ncbi:MAG: hypothetical protein FJ026_00645 [Chloroflexi bacterium]|nr:hypothetical protein [Chloroflexota bacterium]
MNYLQVLGRQSRDHLRVIARQWGVRFTNLPGTAGIVARLATHLADPNRLSQALATLPPEAKDLLLTLKKAGNFLPTWECLARCGPLRPYRPWVSPREERRAKGVGRRAWGEARYA